MKLKQIGLALAATTLVGAAHATVIASGDLSFLGELSTATPIAGSQSVALSGPAELSFSLDGYGSLDGANSYMDIFTLTINGQTMFSGTFDLGGGGSDIAFAQATGVTATRGATDSGTSGTIDFVVPFDILSGTNSVSFSYSSPTSYTSPAGVTYSNLAGPQDIGDEGWGIGRISVSTVPEAGSLAMMLAGLGIVGGLARRRRQA